MYEYAVEVTLDGDTQDIVLANGDPEAGRKAAEAFMNYEGVKVKRREVKEWEYLNG